MSLIHKNTTPLNVEELVSKIQSGRIILDPYWQRGVVWDTKKQEYLIDSILKELHIPELLFCKNEAYQMQSIDGKQRCTTFIRFLTDQFPYKGTLFSKLQSEHQEKIKTYPIACSIYSGLDESQKVEMFRRIQGGSPLRVGEIINSMREQYCIPRFLFEQIATNPIYTNLKNILHIKDDSVNYTRHDWLIWLVALFADFISNQPMGSFGDEKGDDLIKKALKHCSKSFKDLGPFIERYSEYIKQIHWKGFERQLSLLADVVLAIDTDAQTVEFFKKNQGLSTILPIFHRIGKEFRRPPSINAKQQFTNKWKNFLQIVSSPNQTSDDASSDVLSEDDEFKEHYGNDIEKIKAEWICLRRKNICPTTIERMDKLFCQTAFQ